MSARNIQPIQSWSPISGDISIDTLSLTDFYHYHFDNGNGKVSYSLSGINPSTESRIDYFSDSIDIPSSVIQQWGASDDVIWDYVATALGLTLV